MDKKAIILAGGKGSRLEPYTTVLPKPLLPVGDRAIIDVVLHQLRSAGFEDVTLAVGYLAHLVRAVLGEGAERGVRISYHEESEPLGTVGALATIENLDGTFLVMNGDVLTTLDYGKLFDQHQRAGNVLTIASHRRVVRTEFGVLHVDGEAGATSRVTGFEEKPELAYIVSMGVYMMEPRALDFIEPGERLDLPDLVIRLLEAGEPVGSHLYDGFWLDIGRHEDYEYAQREFARLKATLMCENGHQPTEVPGSTV